MSSSGGWNKEILREKYPHFRLAHEKEKEESEKIEKVEEKVKMNNTSTNLTYNLYIKYVQSLFNLS